MWDYCKVTEVPAPSQPNCLRGNDPMQNGITTLPRGVTGARTSIQGKRTPGLARPLRQRTGFNYIDFVRAGVGLPRLWEASREQIYLGTDAFVDRMQRHGFLGDNLDEIPHVQRR